MSDTGSHTWNSGCPRCTREPIPTMKLTTPVKKCDGAARGHAIAARATIGCITCVRRHDLVYACEGSRVARGGRRSEEVRTVDAAALCDAAVLPQKGQDGLAARGGNVGFSVCHAAQLDSAW